MAVVNVVVGLVALAFLVKDGKAELDRIAAILGAVVAVPYLGRRIGRRYWAYGHRNQPDRTYPLDRYSEVVLCFIFLHNNY